MLTPALQVKNSISSTFASASLSKSGQLHCFGNLFIEHEPAPDVTGSQVFGADQSYANVDADNIRINPPIIRIEGIDKTVTIINAISPPLVHCLQRRKRNPWSEH